MMPKVPMSEDEMKMHKPVCADFVSFRAGIRCAERVYDVAEIDRLRLHIKHIGNDALRTQNQALLTERDCAIQMLADWCVAVDGNGSAWDDWDEHYKDAMYRPNPIRELLDAAISKAQAEGGV